MKTHAEVTSSRKKARRAHFGAPSHIRHRTMSASLSKDLRKKYGIRSIPIRKDDEVSVVRGSNKGTRGKIIQVYRKKFVVHIDKLTKTKANGAPFQVGIHPSNVVITKLKEHKDRLLKISKIASGITLRKSKGDKKIRTTNKDLA